MKKVKQTVIDDLKLLIPFLVGFMVSEERSSCQEPHETTPMMDLTVGFTEDLNQWNYQTGDNSFPGGAYGLPIWAIATILSKKGIEEETSLSFQEYINTTLEELVRQAEEQANEVF